MSFFKYNFGFQAIYESIFRVFQIGLNELPVYPSAHEHTAWPALERHWLFGPHGDGEHGLICIGSLATGRHCKKGSPVKSGGQVHVGT